MIRYVLAALLLVAILGTSVGAVEHGAAFSSERQVGGDVASIDRAATSLLEADPPPAGQHGPQRVVTVSLPGDSTTSSPLETFEIERTHESYTTVSYRVAGRNMQTHVIGAPIVSDGDERRLTFEGSGVDRTLLLVLDRDSAGDRVVVIDRL